MTKSTSINQKKIENYSINGSSLNYEVKDFPFQVNSFPKKYNVSCIKNIDQYISLLRTADFIIIDKKVKELYPIPSDLKSIIFTIEAKEENKTLDTVLELINEFIRENISKGNKVIAVGGGIIQDITACACALFRRGQPFSYLPTTTLGQLDSCVGAKCAVNTSNAKNILGLFSAPKEVIIPMFTINTMPILEHRAGLSEMLRLCITASSSAIEEYLNLLPYISEPINCNLDDYEKALKLSLSIKKSVVDFDEYEIDVRRSMNYGHTFGHAIEKLSNFKIPHGLAVLLGIQIANKFSCSKEFMDEEIFQRISVAIKSTLIGCKCDFNFLNNINPSDIVDQFKFDKKGDGESVPLIIINKPGKMIFYRHYFSSNSIDIVESIRYSIGKFIEWAK